MVEILHHSTYALLLLLLPTLPRVIGRLPHKLLLLIGGDFDEAAAGGHIGVCGVRLVSNGLDELERVEE